MQAPIIIKFGGSSLQDPAALLHVQEIIKSINPRPVVVLSAMGGITDSLLDGIKAATTGNDYQGIVAAFKSRHCDLIDSIVTDENLRGPLKKEVEYHSDELLSLYKSLQVLGEISDRTSDRIVARGEKVICQILGGMLASMSLPTKIFDPADLIIVSNQFGSSFPNLELCRTKIRAQLQDALASNTICVVPGFIGSDEIGNLVTLGRGGTDLTATILG